MLLADFKLENPLGSPILPHLRRQMASRIGDYSGKPSSLYLRQTRQSLGWYFSNNRFFGALGFFYFIFALADIITCG